jgi:hypothetical protein
VGEYLLDENPPENLAPQPGHDLLPDDSHVDDEDDGENRLERVEHRDLGEEPPERLAPPPDELLEEPAREERHGECAGGAGEQRGERDREACLARTGAPRCPPR